MRSTRGGGDRLTAPTKGFTLAEVLVTLGIIGVVSAMTIPTLMNNYQRQTYVAQLHKVYTELSQALLQYQTDHNAVNLKEAGLTSTDALGVFIRQYFKVVQDCGTDLTPCFVSDESYRKLSGSIIPGWDGIGERKHIVIASGSSIGYKYRPTGDVLCELYVDVNGQKGPNVVGRDLFPMYIYNNGMIDDIDFATAFAPMTRDNRETQFNTHCNGDSSWYGCFGKILNDNWQMTY